jgi:hypothetical protein
MKPLSLLILTIFLSSTLLGQQENPVFRNTSLDTYSKTDFSKVDSLSCWFYVLMDKNPSYEDSIKPVGQLIFQRTHAVDDSVRKQLYGNGFLPIYTFQVFNIKDSVYCFNKANLIRRFSSCASPDVGGDIIVFGDFIFLNANMCMVCRRYDNGLDYCRPLINKMFLSVDKTKANSLEQIVKQFPIKGQVMKLPF